VTNVTWYARTRFVAGLSADPAGAAMLMAWSADPVFSGASIPWPAPEYPTLLIMGIGVQMTTSAVAGARRLSLTLGQPNSAITSWLSSGTQAASLVRRWEAAQGFSLDTTLAGTVYREPLPRGFMLLPGLVGGPEAQLTVSISGAQAGDVLGPVSVRGMLLYP